MYISGWIHGSNLFYYTELQGRVKMIQLEILIDICLMILILINYYNLNKHLKEHKQNGN